MSNGKKKTYEELLNEVMVDEGFYQYLRGFVFVPLPDAVPEEEGKKPAYRLYAVKGGGFFMYKAEPTSWLNGGKESHDQNLPEKFDGLGVSLNLWVWQTKMREKLMPLIYYATTTTSGKFYICYAETIMDKWQWNIGLSKRGERCIDLSIGCFKRLNIPELKRYYGL